MQEENNILQMILKENRDLEIIGTTGTQNENKVVTMHLTVPEKYKDYKKILVLIIDDTLYWDLFDENDNYLLEKNITKNKSVFCYISLQHEDKDFRSKTEPLYFNDNNPDVSEQITPEEISGVNTIIALLEEEIAKVDNLDIELTEGNRLVTITITDKDGQQKSAEIHDGQDGKDGKDGKDGEDYVITQDDYDAIASIVLENIQIPSKTSDLTNDSGFIDNSTDDLINYYKKSETYNKNEIDSKITSVYKYKGTVATYQDLPSIDLAVGDVYNVEADGSNYAWTGTTWDKLGGDVDLSGYYTSTQVDNLLEGKANTSALNDYYNKTQTDTLLGGKQNNITSQNKLGADLVDDTNSNNKFVTETDKTNWNNKLDESDLDDYVKNTDYANTNTGGVIKTDTNYGTSVANGKLIGQEKDYAQYQNANTNMIIAKGTLENVIAGKQLINQTQLDESQAIQDEKIDNLQEIADNMETVEGEGENFILAPTMKSKVREFQALGNTSQEGTPTPSNPSSIKVVTGNNTVKIGNKNFADISLFDTVTSNGVTATNRNGVVTANGTATANTFINLSTSSGFAVLPAGTYLTLSANNNIGTQTTGYVRLIDRQGSTIAGTQANLFRNPNATATFIFTEDTEYAIQLRIGSGEVLSNFTIKPQIEVGSIATPFVLHTKQVFPLSLGDIFMATVGSHKDKIEETNGNWYIYNKVKKIDSYNGETITTDYISTTGGLDIGATIYYNSSETLEITDTTLIEQLNAIKNANTYKEQTVVIVTSDTMNNAQMQVKVVAFKDFQSYVEEMIGNIETLLGGI